MSKVIHHKYYKNSNACTFALVWADWAVRAVLKISALLLKYPTFERFFSGFHVQNNYKIRVSAHFRVRTKKLMNIKVRKTANITF